MHFKRQNALSKCIRLQFFFRKPERCPWFYQYISVRSGYPKHRYFLFGFTLNGPGRQEYNLLSEGMMISVVINSIQYSQSKSSGRWLQTVLIVLPTLHTAHLAKTIYGNEL